jgi:hypothetical protein
LTSPVWNGAIVRIHKKGYQKTTLRIY